MLRKLISLVCFSTLVFSKSSGQVNLQSGSATFSLPIFNWQDGKSRLNSIVALSYNSGMGLKTNEVASCVGQGWSLVAGGEIIRMQAGEPDDQPARNGAETDITKYPAGRLYATVPAANGYSNALTKYPIFGAKNQFYTQHNILAEDKQLDYFSFQFNGKSGLFVLDPSNLGTAKSLGDSKFKITFSTDVNLQNQGIRTTITAFTIQDDEGLIYRFSAKGLSKVLQTNFCDKSFSHVQKQPKFKDGKVYHQAAFDLGPSASPWVNSEIANPFIVTSWYLTEIEDALTGRKVIFNYNTRFTNHTGGDNISCSENSRKYAIISRQLSITRTPALTSIAYPDGHTATFNYGAGRHDLNGDYAMSSIDITYQGRYLSKHELATSYFILNRYGTPVTPFQKRVARLCLKSVRKIGIDLKEDSPPYLFDYYTGSSAAGDVVPPAFSYAKDIWGYYNGDNSKGYWYETLPLDAELNQITNYNYLKGLCYRRHDQGSQVILNAKAGYAKNGLLRQIIYPTGGTLTYEYEQNRGYLNGTEQNVGGVHISKTSSTDGGNSNNNCNNPISTQYNFITAPNQSSMWGLEMPVTSMYSLMHYQPEYKVYKYKLSCFPFGCCSWKFQHPGIMSMNQYKNLSDIQKFVNAVSPVLSVISAISTIQNAIKVMGGEGNPVILAIDLVVSLVNLGLTCIGDQSRDTWTTVYYNSDLNNASPLPTQYKRVEVIEGSGGIGKTIQEFTSSDDYAIWHPTNPTFSHKQRFAPWAYGLPKRTAVYDVSGNLVKETINQYSIGDSCGAGYGEAVPPGPCHPKVKKPLNLFSAKNVIIRNYSQRNVHWSNPSYYNSEPYLTSSNSDMWVDIYDLYTGRAELKSTKERVYKVGTTDYAESLTQFYYNTVHNYELNKIATTQSNGDINFKFIKYSSDYSGGALSTLVANNMVSVPVSTYSAVLKNGASIQDHLGERVTEYTQLGNGDIKPLRVLEQRLAQPSAFMSTYGGPGSSIAAYKITQTFTYDAAGNLTGLTDEGSRSVSSIYDYDDKYIVATVLNAEPATDKRAYSSFETTVTGNWTLSGSASYNTSMAITGSRSFNLSSGKSFTSALLTGKTHTVSFWSTSAGISLSSGSTLKKSGPSYHGFTYYEYEIAAGQSSVTVSGTGTIDELRLYPSSARMRTVTYDPVMGKTSECDENNRITYYEYDKLGRLWMIKDEKKNIVKVYEYNNISTTKQNGCPGIYYNKLISEIFVRECAPGYQGGEVHYTVPANTFSSTISQADADAQAEYYLLQHGQTYANTNGTCSILYCNAAISVTDTTESCPPGYIGGLVTYTVPAGRYCSTISQADADEQAQDDIDANLDWYVNSPVHGICNVDYNPQWEWNESGEYYCQNVNGVPHLFILETDINPNSATYGQTRWADQGPSELCPPAACDSNNCPAPQYKCIDTKCEEGVKVVTDSYWNGTSYICVYHYEFSDGSWSITIYEDTGPYACM